MTAHDRRFLRLLLLGFGPLLIIGGFLAAFTEVGALLIFAGVGMLAAAGLLFTRVSVHIASLAGALVAVALAVPMFTSTRSSNGSASGSESASAPAAGSATAVVVAPSATPSPGATADAIYWALDRGSEGTPDQERLRVYLFATRGAVGVVTLHGPDGAAAGRALVMGSGMFTEASCMTRVPGGHPGLVAIGPVVMTNTEQSAFLANPTAYRAALDQQGLGMVDPKQVDLTLMDTGCRPAA